MPTLELTDRFVANAKPDAGKRQSDYFDTSTHGLVLRASEGTRTFGFMYSQPGDGKRVRITLGSYPILSLGKARTLVKECKQFLAGGKDPRALIEQQKTAEMTAKTLIEAYVKH